MDHINDLDHLYSRGAYAPQPAPMSGSPAGGAKPYGPAGAKKEDVYEGTVSDDQQQDFGGMQGTHKGIKITSPSGETKYFSDKRPDVRAVNTFAGIVPEAIVKPAGSLVGGPRQQMAQMNPIPMKPIGGGASNMADDDKR